MTISIITPGKLKINRIYRGRCKDCGCEFDFEWKDAKLRTDSTGRRDSDYLEINCPQDGCDNILWISI
jgi:hypothetical protein